jgi:uncharacterized protein YecE (DUF72 family)
MAAKNPSNVQSERPSAVVGCAGWSLSRQYAAHFAAQGTHLQRYGARLGGVEINSSFYRPHRRETYVRWAESVPDDFRFSVKAPKLITHGQRLQGCEQLLDLFISQCSGLGAKLGCLLVQLPPSLTFDEAVAEAFFAALRQRFAGGVVLEPRHASWAAAEPLLQAQRIARAAVDPSRLSGDSTPAGWSGLRYWRLHGSPRIYHDSYDTSQIQSLAVELVAAARAGAQSGCIFDNTASGAALGNALELAELTDHSSLN